MPSPTYFSLPFLTSSSQTACGNWIGGVMATISEPWPLLKGPPAIFDSSSRRVTLRRLLNALKAALSCSDVGGKSGVDIVGSLEGKPWAWGISSFMLDSWSEYQQAKSE